MSTRKPQVSGPDQLRHELMACKSAAIAMQASDMPDADHAATNAAAEGALSWDELTTTEKAVASLGVAPDSLKPIAFMNTAHVEIMKEEQAFSGDLVRRLSAYEEVAKASSTA